MALSFLVVGCMGGPVHVQSRSIGFEEGFALFNKQENLGIEEKRYKQHCHVLDPVEAVLCEKYYHCEESPHSESQCNFPFSYL